MAFPQHHFQQQYQSQQQQPKSFRSLYTIDGQISSPVTYYDPTNVQDQSQHPPYVPPFHVVGFAPGPAAAADCSDIGAGLQWNNNNNNNYGGFESNKKKRLKEQDFLENNSQISSIDFMQPRSVSTGLGLSLDNTRMASSTGDSALLSLISDDIDREFQQQDADMERFLKIQGDRLRQNIMEKIQATQLETMSLMEERVVEKLREKQAEAESISRKNEELEERMEQLAAEAGAWQQRAKSNEDIISTLKSNLHHVFAARSTRDSKEGCGDSEVDDTASCCGGGGGGGHSPRDTRHHRGGGSAPPTMTCKACGVHEVRMLLLPCKHLCLCRDCESKLSFCPVCQSSKFIGMEVYM